MLEKMLEKQKGGRAMVERMLGKMKRLIVDDRGPSAIEYGLIAALIALLIIAGVTLIGTRLSEVFCLIAEGIGAGACGA